MLKFHTVLQNLIVHTNQLQKLVQCIKSMTGVQYCTYEYMSCVTVWRFGSDPDQLFTKLYWQVLRSHTKIKIIIICHLPLNPNLPTKRENWSFHPQHNPIFQAAIEDGKAWDLIQNLPTYVRTGLFIHNTTQSSGRPQRMEKHGI